MATSHVQLDDNPAMYEVEGKISSTNQSVKAQVWSTESLATVCYDGVLMRQHLTEELRFQQIVTFVSPLLGVIEKRESMGTKVSVVYDNIEHKGYKQLSAIIKQMGGLIKIPSLVFSGQLVYIAKLWMQQVLEFQIEI
jgi:hypothetical protein